MNLRTMWFTLSIFILTSCGGGSQSSNNSNKVYRIMPLGDSITYDDAHAYTVNGKDIMPEGKRTAYRSFLAWDLDDTGIKYNFVGSRRAGYDVEPKFDPDNEGHPGWTSFEIADNIYNFLLKNPADVILLHIGTNDKYYGGGERVDGVEKILNEINRYKKDSHINIKIFVALIINREFEDRVITRFNNNLEIMLSERNDDSIVIVDMRNILTSEDYLEYTHPNKNGYKKMADTWFRYLSDYLN